MIRTLACVGLSLILAPPLTAEVIYWQTLPLVGVAELKDGKPADGVVYAVQRFIEQALPEYKHLYKPSAPLRLYHDLETGLARCSTVLLQDANLDRVGYFVPFAPTLPMQLIVRSDIREQLTFEQGAVSLNRIMQQTRLKGAIVSGRGYPKELQELLEQGIEQGRIQSMNSSSTGQNLLSMIQAGRIDYTLEFPIVIKRHEETSNLSATLLGIPIVENQELSTSGFYCARTSWGRKIAERLDQAVRAITAKPDQLMPLYQATNDPSTFKYFEPKVRAWLAQRANTPTEF